MYKFLFFLLFFASNINNKVFSQQNFYTIEDFIREKSLKHASISFIRMDFNSGDIIEQYLSNMSLKPASVLKLFPTALALDKLGPDFTWKTTIKYDGFIDDGVLFGNIYIIGGGDPSFASKIMYGEDAISIFLNKIKQQLTDFGICKIKGKIYVQNGDYNLPPKAPTWMWYDIGNYYATGYYGFNFNENYFEIEFEVPNKLNASTQIIRYLPQSNDFVINNEVVVGEIGTGDQAYVYATPESKKLVIRGTLDKNFGRYTIKAAMPRPSKMFQGILTSFLVDNQFLEINDTPMSKQKYIGQLESKPLIDIVKICNHKSNNLFADAIFQTIIVKKHPTNHFIANKLFKEELNIFGIETNGLFIHDGSGLSPQNAVSASQIAQLLFSQKDNNLFKSTLARSKETGTLKHFNIKGFLGKSGSFSQVQSYAGYFNESNSNSQIIVVIVNNFEGSRAELNNKIIKLIE